MSFSCKIALRVPDQVFQFWLVSISRLVPGGMVKLADAAVFMRAAETVGREEPLPEPPVPEREPPEPEGGTEGPVVSVLEAIDVVRQFLSPRSVSNSELKGSKTEGRSLSCL